MDVSFLKDELILSDGGTFGCGIGASAFLRSELRTEPRVQVPLVSQRQYTTLSPSRARNYTATFSSFNVALNISSCCTPQNWCSGKIRCSMSGYAIAAN